jgi:predicted metal-dependent peptidase
MSTDPLPIRPDHDDSSRLKAMLLIARDSFVRESPFLGALVLKLPLTITNDPRIRTACVDGRGWCYFDRTFLSALELQEVRAILLHETLHVALDFFGRKGSRHHLRWNVAHDFAVNALIDQSNLSQGFLAWPRGFFPLRNENYANLPAEVIYDQLPENLATLGLGEQDVLEDQWERMSEEERGDARRLWQQRLVEAAESAMGTQGINCLPKWAQKLLGPILEPQVAWQVRLAQKVHGHLEGRRRTFARPGRRSQAVGHLLPGARPDVGTVGVFLDVSGSISSRELGAFLGELLGILQETEVATRIIHWDTDISADVWIDEPDALRTALSAELHQFWGGGGTNPQCLIDHLRDSQAEALPLPSYGLLLTDGLVPWPAVRDWPIELLVVTTLKAPPPELGYDFVMISA